MEDLTDLGGRGHPAGAARPTPGSPFPSSSKVSVQVFTVPSSASGGGARAQVVAPAILHESSGSGHGVRGGDLDPVKAKIVSHPRYHGLLAAFLDCHKARTRARDHRSITPHAHAHVIASADACGWSLYMCVFIPCRMCSACLGGLPAGGGRGDRGGDAGARGVAARSRRRRRRALRAGPGARPVHGGVPNQQSSHGQGGHEEVLIIRLI